MLDDLLRPAGLFASPATFAELDDAIATETRRRDLLAEHLRRVEAAGDDTAPHRAALAASERELAFLSARKAERAARLDVLRRGTPGLGDVIREELETLSRR